MKVRKDMLNIESDLDKLLSHQDKKLLESVLNSLKEKYNLDKNIEIVLSEKKENKDFLPCSIFHNDLGVFESVVKFLHEDKKLDFKQISKITKRTHNNIAVTYLKSKKKYYPEFDIDYSNKIPLTVFSEKYTCFESICLYLKKTFNYHEIAQLLDRDDRTIWTTYQRAIKRGGKK